jgi:nucleoside-diphosphate kinase
MAIEQSFVMLKPDALKKSLTGNILTRFSETKLDIVATKIVEVNERMARTHYNNLDELVQQDRMSREVYEGIIKYIMGELHDEGRVNKADGWEHIRRKVMPLVYMGQDAVLLLREISGLTNPEKANPTSIRGQYGRITSDGVWENVVHSSANAREAKREIKLWFKPEEIRQKIDSPEFNISYPNAYYFITSEENERLIGFRECRFENGVSYFYSKGDVYFLNSGLLYKVPTEDLSIEERAQMTYTEVCQRFKDALLCARLIISPNQQVWASDLKAIIKATNSGIIDHPANLAISKYLVNTESYTQAS